MTTIPGLMVLEKMVAVVLVALVVPSVVLVEEELPPSTMVGTQAVILAVMAAAGLSPRRVDMSTIALIIAVSSTAVLIVSYIFLELHIPELRIGETDRLSFMLDAYITAMI